MVVTMPASLGDSEREPDRDRREFRLLMVPSWVGAKRFRERSGRGGGGGIAFGFAFTVVAVVVVAVLLLTIVVVGIGVVLTGRDVSPTLEDEGAVVIPPTTTDPFSMLADILNFKIKYNN